MSGRIPKPTRCANSGAAARPDLTPAGLGECHDCGYVGKLAGGTGRLYPHLAYQPVPSLKNFDLPDRRR